MKRGKYLTRLRLKAGLSQNDIAEKLNYSPQLVSLWEKDKNEPDLRVIAKYAKLLNVDLKSFITLKEHKKNNNCIEREFNIDRFSSNLRFLRKDKKLLQSDIAKKTKTNVKTIGSWESGASTPTISNFITLCTIFNKSFDELYFAYEEEIKEENKKKKLVPILISIGLIVIGGSGLGITLGINMMNKVDEKVDDSSSTPPSTPPSTEEVHVHKFSTSTINATYEADGSITYTCECGYSYTEVLPKLVHTYSETYSYNKHYHYRECLDEGYEELYVDKDEHDIVSSMEGSVKKYSCSICDFSYTSEDYITVVDYLNEDGKPEYSVYSKNNMYLTLLNASKYPVTALGYHLELKDDPSKYSDGTTFLHANCLDAPDYTLFSIDSSLFNALPGLVQAGNVLKMIFTTTSYDPSLLSVECDPFYITITL